MQPDSSAPWSMAGRLTRQLTLGLVLLWLAAVTGAGTVVKFEMDEVFDSVLSEAAQHMLSDILARHDDELASMRPDDPPVVPNATPHEEYITWQLLSGDGRLLMRSHRAPATAPQQAPPPGFSDTSVARTYVERSADGRFLFLIAEPGPHRRHAIRQTLVQLLLPMAVLILGTLLLVPVVVRRALLPVRRLEDALERRGGGNLAEIGSLGLPRELSPIRQDVNLLLRRLREALEAERHFAANAAHELRTPVAAALAQAQLLARQLASGGEDQRRAQLITEDLRRLGRRVEKLLQLGRAEAGVARSLAPTDLLLPLHLVIGEMPDGDRVQVEDAGCDRLMVLADVDMLAIALRNLLENALRHGDPRQPVTVRIDPRGAVHVVNGGPALPPGQVAGLLKRFVRHGTAEGSGIGLAIVRTIAGQVGGALDLYSPARGCSDGFEAVLTLPLARSSERQGGGADSGRCHA